MAAHDPVWAIFSLLMSSLRLGRHFDIADLKQQTATVFLVLLPDRLGSYARWLHLLVTRGPGSPGPSAWDAGDSDASCSTHPGAAAVSTR